MPTGVYDRSKMRKPGWKLPLEPAVPRDRGYKGKPLKYPIQTDGYAHCPEPGCEFKHTRSSAIGRHRMIHTGAYTRTQQHQPPTPKGDMNVEPTQASDRPATQADLTPVVYFLAGRLTEVISHTALTAGCSAGELTERVVELLHPLSGRKIRRA